MAGSANPTSSAGHAPARTEADYELTLNFDHSVGADQFDVRKTEQGLDCLSLYRREWDEKNQVFREKPLHDWTSNGSDAARTLAMGLEKKTRRHPQTNNPPQADWGSYSPHSW